MNQSIKRLNDLNVADATAEFLKCCGSKRWAANMSAARPFADVEELFAKADEIWWSLTEPDWREAFRAHPKIGEQKAAVAQSQQTQSWSAQEQSAVADASAQTKDELARLNREYENRFGFIFILCASGKSSEEMLANLNSRIDNSLDRELRVAAGEQSKITLLRLAKLLPEQVAST